jgi:hypothetical protein
VLGSEPLDLTPHLHPRLRIKARGRLVEEQHLRAVQQAHGDLEPPLHAPRIGPHLASRGLGQPETLQGVGDALLELAPGQPVELALQHEVLPAGRLRIGTVLLADHADRSSHADRIGEHVDPADLGAPAVGSRQRRQHANRGRLASAVGPEQPEDRPRLDGHADPVKRGDRGRVGLSQILRLDRQCHLPSCHRWVL